MYASDRNHCPTIDIDACLHSSPKETQVFESCISFGEDCMPLDLGSYMGSFADYC